MNHKPYISINDVLKDTFGEKIIKLSLDGGFSCPNRDGTCGIGGCSFCSETGSGEFAGSRSVSISEQIQEQIALLRPKWPSAKYIAYFQSFTNTYAPVERLRALYDEALAYPDVVGLAIATRPDCLSQEVLELLAEYQSRTYLWVELGLQTIHAHTAKRIRRGYSLDVYDHAMHELNRRGIRAVVHLILNLPGESAEDMHESVQYVVQSRAWGIKLQMLNILTGTQLAREYEEAPFPLMSADEYIALIRSLLALIPPTVIVHRLTGDGDKARLIAPRWVCNKRHVLNRINQPLDCNK